MEGLVWVSDSIVGGPPMNQSRNQKLGDLSQGGIAINSVLTGRWGQAARFSGK